MLDESLQPLPKNIYNLIRPYLIYFMVTVPSFRHVDFMFLFNYFSIIFIWFLYNIILGFYDLRQMSCLRQKAYIHSTYTSSFLLYKAAYCWIAEQQSFQKQKCKMVLFNIFWSATWAPNIKCHTTKRYHYEIIYFLFMFGLALWAMHFGVMYVIYHYFIFRHRESISANRIEFKYIEWLK